MFDFIMLVSIPILMGLIMCLPMVAVDAVKKVDPPNENQN